SSSSTGELRGEPPPVCPRRDAALVVAAAPDVVHKLEAAMPTCVQHASAHALNRTRILVSSSGDLNQLAALFLILPARLLAGVNPCYRGAAASSTTSVDANYRGVLAFLDISAHTGRPSLVNFDDQLWSISALENMPPSAPAPYKLWPTALRRLSSI